MITFEQFVTWMSVFIAMVSAGLFTGAYLLIRHYNRRDQRSTDGRIKDEMLMAERKRSKQEAQQAAAQQVGRVTWDR